MLPDPDRSRAVLIGASRFTDPALDDLPAVRNNLDGLATCLRDSALWGLPPTHCTVVADPKSSIALVDPIHDAARAAEDTLIVYYAGHGLMHPRTLGLLLAVVTSVPGRTHTAVSYDLVRENLIESPAARKVVILDCCYSGRALGGMADSTTAVVDEASVEGTYLLASAPPNKHSLSPPGELYTAFTGALLALLTKGVPDGPPLLQLDIIYRQVRNALRRGLLPEPQLRADNTAGDLALVRNRSWRKPTPARRQSSQATGKSKQQAKKRAPKPAPPKPAVPQPIKNKNDNQPDRPGDPYQIGKRIGGHGDIRIYSATDTRTHQQVVVKEAPADGVREPRLRLIHPGIVRFLDSYSDTTRSGQQVLFIVMEEVDGRTLAEVLTLHGRLRPSQAIEIISDVCAALDYGHQQDIVHGDVDLTNVMITRSNTVKLLNFGIRPYNRGISSDIHSAGELLFTLLTGNSYYRGISYLTAQPPVPSRIIRGIPAELDRIVDIATGANDRKPYETAADMRADLMRLRVGRYGIN